MVPDFAKTHRNTEAHSKGHGADEGHLLELTLGESLHGVPQGAESRLGQSGTHASKEPKKKHHNISKKSTVCLGGLRHIPPNSLPDRHQTQNKTNVEANHTHQSGQQAGQQSPNVCGWSTDPDELHQEQEAHQGEHSLARRLCSLHKSTPHHKIPVIVVSAGQGGRIHDLYCRGAQRIRLILARLSEDDVIRQCPHCQHRQQRSKRNDSEPPQVRFLFLLLCNKRISFGSWRRSSVVRRGLTGNH
mmetsp:Transcript_58701/g.128626  ORF Transcript_58701/g.128626 Transcript_58701/m.128626 type:complete len:245 (+) Transcript_58701:382-1116(+)